MVFFRKIIAVYKKDIYKILGMTDRLSTDRFNQFMVIFNLSLAKIVIFHQNNMHYIC